MKKQVIIGLVVVLALVLVAGGSYVAMNRDDDNSNTKTSETGQLTDGEQEHQAVTESTFQGINSSGEARYCEISYSGDQGQGDGTIYTDGQGRGRMSLQFNTAQGNTGASNTLVTADKAYAWFTSEGSAIGFVYDKAVFESNQSTANTSGPTPDQKFSMDCHDWDVDESVLTPPTDVNFSTMPTLTQ